MMTCHSDEVSLRVTLYYHSDASPRRDATEESVLPLILYLVIMNNRNVFI
jgi:hypothetical protein